MLNSASASIDKTVVAEPVSTNTLGTSTSPPS